MAEPHPPYQELPPLSVFDYEALKASVAEHGFLEPVDVDEDGNTLDGHHRLRIADELGIDPPEQRVVPGLDEEGKRRFALLVNLARRHMSTEEKRQVWRRHREMVAERLRQNPAASNRQVAEKVGVDHKTVGTVRRALEETGEVPSYRASGGRGQREGAPVPEPELDRREVANHRDESHWELTGYYNAPSDEERTRGGRPFYGGLPYRSESGRLAWNSGTLVVTVPPPTTAAEEEAYCEAIKQALLRKMREKPLRTMRAASEAPARNPLVAAVTGR